MSRESSPVTPFAREQRGNVAGWFAGLFFGLVCIGTGMVVVASFVVLGLALAVGYVVRRGIRAVQPRTQLAAS